MATRTSRSFPLLAAGLLAGMLGALLAMPLVAAHAAEQATDEPFLDEGWWLRYRNPEEELPKEQLPTQPPPEASIPGQTARGGTNPYGGEYARVSAVPGETEDEAMAAFGFDLLTLGDGLPPTITGGEVTFVIAPRESRPQAGDGANGMRNEQKAAMRGCLVTDMFSPEVAGNWADRPPTDCKVSSPLVLVEGSDPLTWKMDLGPFVATWSDPNKNFGFAVTSDPEGDPEGQFFHVAFPTTLNTVVDPATHPVVTATFTYEKEELEAFGNLGDAEGFGDSQSFDTGTASSDGDLGSSSFDSGSTGSFDSGSSGGGFGSSSSGTGGTSSTFDPGDAPISAADEVVEEPQTADDAALFDDEAPAAVPEVEGALAADAEDASGGLNAGYILLPLLGLGLATTLGYSLTKEPELPDEREGAVSKLMQRRQAQGAIGPNRPGSVPAFAAPADRSPRASG